MRILLIEDDHHFADELADRLRYHYALDICYAGRDGENQANQNEYDLVILDAQLSDVDGITICQHLRQDDIKTPILMMSSSHDLLDKVRALDCGADDYLIKPFEYEELSARIRVLLRRRSEVVTSQMLNIEDLSLDTATNTVTRNGKKISLRRKELQLLEYLMRNRGRTLTRDMIVEHIWDNASDPLTNTVDVHIKYLRDRVDKNYNKKLIKTVYGLGYKIDA